MQINMLNTKFTKLPIAIAIGFVILLCSNVGFAQRVTSIDHKGTKLTTGNTVTEAATAPTSPTPIQGDVWIDTTYGVTNVWGGSAWKLIDDSNVPLWKNNTNGGVYTTNDIINYNGALYKNLTGTNTDSTPDIDSTNWDNILTSSTHEFRAAQVSAGFTFPDYTLVDIPYTNEEYDVSNAYNPTTGEYTVPETGIYMFTWNIVMPSSVDQRLSDLYVNDVLTSRGFQTDSSSNETSLGTAPGTAILKLTKDDVVKIKGFQRSNPIGPVTAPHPTLGSLWYFSGIRITG
jgi:hypothetical protein